MKRKQIYITEPQQNMLTVIKEKMGTTEAEVIRRILDVGIDVIRRELEAKLK